MRRNVLATPPRNRSPSSNVLFSASSNPNEIVLDGFCGCGTALVAAQNLGRSGSASTSHPPPAASWRNGCAMCAISAKMKNCGVQDAVSWCATCLGRRKKLRQLPPFEFENWAVIALGGIPTRRRLATWVSTAASFPSPPHPRSAARNQASWSFMDHWYPIQVKQKDRVGRPDIDSFEAVMTREDRTKGSSSLSTSRRTRSRDRRVLQEVRQVIVALTVREILDEQLAKKLA